VLPSLAEIFKALYGIFLLLRMHSGAAGMFNLTVGGFWKSLFAGVLVLPAHVLLTIQTVEDAPAVPFGIGDVITDLLIYVIVWLAYPVMMVAVTRVIDRQARFIDYIVPYNWAMVPVGYLLGAITCLGLFGHISRETEINLFIIAYAAVSVMLAVIAQRQLRIGPFLAFGIVILDIGFNVVLINLLETFAQQPGAPA
jgi:hypothetical protein